MKEGKHGRLKARVKMERFYFFVANVHVGRGAEETFLRCKYFFFVLLGIIWTK